MAISGVRKGRDIRSRVERREVVLGQKNIIERLQGTRPERGGSIAKFSAHPVISTPTNERLP